ncbi:hypothetical protein PVAP13_4KG156225 [Panicum virgatum]|uniref:Pentatricopeptide repeat-containing protein n=1 Tax=Panicum virgatum TaxID=38727 RepID=A0A8T0TV84_PANVG|nr:hypothetical protein PVAP13_4KG156225 [Panicum virgatum]
MCVVHIVKASRVHKNTSLAEEVAKKIMELEPRCIGSHVVLSNVYSASGRWNEAARLRKSMRNKGMKKDPACSWIDVKNKLHVFVAHDRSHPWYDRIIDALNVFSEKMALQGYVPNTEDVVQDIEESRDMCYVVTVRNLLYVWYYMHTTWNHNSCDEESPSLY